MTRLYGYHQAETIAYRAIREQFGWMDVAQYRKWEWPHALLALDAQEHHEVLSIGAWSCGVTIALSGRVKSLLAVDTHSHFESWGDEHFAPDTPDSFTTHIQHDARSMPFLAGASFDRVLCVSVLEHVRPEKDGDIDVAREIGRVLRPGGIAVITLEVAREWVPWQMPVGRLYDYVQVWERVMVSSGLELLNPEGLDWDAGDWDHIWPDIYKQGMCDLIPAALVLRKASR